MGKDFISLKRNGMDLVSAFDSLKDKEIIEYSEGAIKSFNDYAIFLNDIDDIEIGVNSTKESIFRLKNGSWIVVNGTVII